jgi:hypothetical protein
MMWMMMWMIMWMMWMDELDDGIAVSRIVASSFSRLNCRERYVDVSL